MNLLMIENHLVKNDFSGAHGIEIHVSSI